MTAPLTKRTNSPFSLIESVITPIGEEILLESIDANRAHCFAGIKFFSDAEGAVPAIPDAGVVRVSVQTINTDPIWEIVSDPDISAAKPTTTHWGGNTRAVRAKSFDVTIASYYQLVVTCNGT